MIEVTDILAERQNTHGCFIDNAECAQALKTVARTHAKEELPAIVKEALDNICQKMSRILTGSWQHADSWVDIAGYATLVTNYLDDQNGTS